LVSAWLECVVLKKGLNMIIMCCAKKVGFSIAGLCYGAKRSFS
jgi:hypothetical protein